MMKKLFVCCSAVLCMALSGCAEARQQAQETEPPAEAEPAPEDDAFSGRWQAVDTPQYYMEIRSGDGGGYAIEITHADASRGNTVWQVTGVYDETWEGVAYVGGKYEDTVREDGSVDRIPIPAREEVTGMVYLEDGGALRWIDDFDHAGDDLCFERE